MLFVIAISQLTRMLLLFCQNRKEQVSLEIDLVGIAYRFNLQIVRLPTTNLDDIDFHLPKDLSFPKLATILGIIPILKLNWNNIKFESMTNMTEYTVPQRTYLAPLAAIKFKRSLRDEHVTYTIVLRHKGQTRKIFQREVQFSLDHIHG